MNRRAFVKNIGLASVLPLMGNMLWACRPHSSKNKIFVFIQLIGGNDGLNTLIPLDNYKNVVAARKNIYIPENKILDLKGNALTGLHPAMAGIRDMYENNHVGFIQNVGYQHQSYSHFRSADIWLTGSRAEESLYTGWMARFLENTYQGYPAGFPNSIYPYPPAIKVGDTGTMLFEADIMDMSIVLSPSDSSFADNEQSQSSDQQNIYATDEVASIKEILLQTEQYSGVLKDALGNSFQHSSLYPPTGENPLADQLKVVAKLIHGGIQTQVYHVDLKGFDTHEYQADTKDTTKGVHADLLSKLSQAITAFWDDMIHIGREEDVAGMTFSEFGRRIIANSSYGTDHGAAQPILIFGKNIHAGIIGGNPIIPDNVNVVDNLEASIHFKSVYASLLKDWFGSNDAILKHAIAGNFPTIDVFKASSF